MRPGVEFLVERFMKLADIVPLLLLGAVTSVIWIGRSAAAAYWRPPASAAPYRDLFAKAAADAGVPELLLLRVAHQESGFRPEVIDGRVSSPAGAKGIMQIVPRWHPGVDPLDPWEAVPYAARYLAQLKKTFGSWAQALAAYNWGQGNLRRWIDAGGVGPIPAETQRYVAEIMQDAFAGERVA